MLSLFRPLSRMPLRGLHAIGAILGWCVFLASPTYRRRFLAHAAQAGYGFAQVRPAVAHIGRMVAELPRLWLGAAPPVEWDQVACIDAAYAQGQGVILLTPHLGCFEIVAQALALRYQAEHGPLTVLFRPARKAWIAPVVAASRQRPGLSAVPTTLAGVRHMIRALRQGQAVGLLSGEGHRLLAHSAASLINGLVPLPPQPLDAAGLARLRRRGPQGRPLPGLVLVGSHVPLADQQLERLLQDPACVPIELPVAKLARVWAGPTPLELLVSLEHAWVRQLREACSTGQTPVLFTSRGELQCASAAERRRLGLELAALMARLAAALAPQLGYLISKGGITTHTLLADGLQCDQVELQGQLLPGLSLVLAGDLPVVTFPGNLGEAHTLHQAWKLMESAQ